MDHDIVYLASKAEELFIQLFSETFGPDQTRYLREQYSCVDIYGNQRFIDFVLLSDGLKIAIEIDGELYHNPYVVSHEKYYDDLLKQNSLIFDNWKLYRWTYLQLKKYPERIKDEFTTFFGQMPHFKALEDFLPRQKGSVIELKGHQESALDSLEAMRNKGETIGLLYHATGTGKTFTAISDAKRLGKRTLFLAHTRELVAQAKRSFKSLWPQTTVGLFAGEQKDTYAHVICATVQSMSQNLAYFKHDDFGYLIVDECHHGTADSYRRILEHFEPEFTLGLTATPERTDGEDLLEIFQNIAHKLDLKTAVDLGELVPVRCIRVKTNVDLSSVRINGVRYRSQDLESKLFVPERNNIIVDTYLRYVKNKKTVIFCASVKHAEDIAKMLRDRGVKTQAVSGRTKPKDRQGILKRYEHGDIDVLCACDLLNEGWDSPRTEILFMARPTLSKTLYLQQLGRGMRLSEGKEYLMVFDFIDNASLFNMPYSMHRVFNIKEYRPGGYVVAPQGAKKHDEDLFRRGEKPEVYLDFPIDVLDFELVELFDWQEEVRDMISQLEFVRMVDVQSETIGKYIGEGRIVPDLEVPLGGTRSFKYFHESTVKAYAAKFGWELITARNMKEKFMEMVKIMDMNYSYKPVLLKAMFDHVDERGRVKIEYIVDYFLDFYDRRRQQGLLAERRNSIYCRPDISRKDAERNIFANPFKRFEDMRFMKRRRELEYVEFNRHIFKKLTREDIRWIVNWCDEKLEEYYAELKT